MSLNQLIRTAAAAVMILGLAACATGPSDTGAPAEPVADGPASVGNPGDPISFTAFDVETGEELDGSAFKGQDTILWFWASWCPVCEAQSGAILNAMAEPDFPDDVTIVGVAGLSNADEAKVFVEEHGVGTFQHVYDTDGSIWQSFGVTAQPTLAYIDADGTFELKQGGYGKWDILEDAQELAAN